MVKIPGTTTYNRLRLVSSINAPAGAVINMPATPPMVITVPIGPLFQPLAKRKIPKKRANAGLHIGHKKN